MDSALLRNDAEVVLGVQLARFEILSDLTVDSLRSPRELYGSCTGLGNTDVPSIQCFTPSLLASTRTHCTGWGLAVASVPHVHSSTTGGREHLVPSRWHCLGRGRASGGGSKQGRTVRFIQCSLTSRLLPACGYNVTGCLRLLSPRSSLTDGLQPTLCPLGCFLSNVRS